MSGLVVNLFGGPGTGKSENMAGVFREMKRAGIDCEQAPEFAKEAVWEERFNVLKNQIYIFGKQYHRIWRAAEMCDVVVTDSPILLSIHYNEEYEHLNDLVLEAHNDMDTLNIFLVRTKEYNSKGRIQTEEEAKVIDGDLKQMLAIYDIPHVVVIADEDAPKKILEMIKTELGLL